MPSFNDVYNLLMERRLANIVSSIGTQYTICAYDDKIVATSANGGKIYIHADCWGKNITCKGTRASGIYNGRPSITDWYSANK